MKPNLKFGYIVNIPMKYEPDTLELRLQKVMQTTAFLKDREAKVVIGFNSSQPFDTQTLNRIRDVFSRLSQQLQNEELFFFTCFTWQPDAKGKIPYGAIRSHLFSLDHNNQIYQQMLNKKLTKIFYLTLDADTCLTPEILQQVEDKESKRVSPFVLCGFYKFAMGDIQTTLIQPDGTLNWKGFLAKLDAEKSACVRKDLAKLSRLYNKHPYTLGGRSKQECEQNCYTLRGISFNQEGQMCKEVYQLAKLYDDFIRHSTIDSHQHLSKKEEKFQKVVTKLRQKETEGHLLSSSESTLVKINRAKQIFGSIFIYPAEPLLFVSLFQETPYGSIDFQRLVTEQPIQTMWGTEGHQEGVVLLANIKELWKQMKEKQPALKRAVVKDPRKYVDFTFEYQTELPERCYRISEEALKYLPNNLAELQEALSCEEFRINMENAIRYIFRGRCQTAFSSNNHEHALKRLFVQNTINPQRPFQRCKKTQNFMLELIERDLKRFTETSIDAFINYVFLQIRRSVQEFHLENQK
jgi:hypothetical protein